jgi:uncharacterized membrane protein
MDATYLHLVLTHFPIVGTVIGIGILVYGQFSKHNEIKKVAFATFILLAILTMPVYLTGEGAEETVEHLPGVSESLIESHEELAETAIWLMGLLGVLSLINLFAIIKKLSFAKTLTLITLVVSLGTFGIFAKVGSLGGEIRHSEIRSINLDNNGENGVLNGGEKEKHDDDDDD